MLSPYELAEERRCTNKGDAHMRRAIAILLAFALISSASVAYAGSIGLEEVIAQGDISECPDLSIFAALHASVPDEFGRVTVTLSEPVDRLWANWMGKGEKPEELFLDENLTAKLSTKGHPYQVGAMPAGSGGMNRQETSKRYIIQFGALQSQINWRTIQAQNAANDGDSVEVVLPHWILYRVSDDVVYGEYSDKLNCTDIEVPEGFKLQRVDGYAVSWRLASEGSDGSPNLAYITLQKGYVVIYSRSGKIQYVTEYSPDMMVFGVNVGASASEGYSSRLLYAYNVPARITEYRYLPEMPSIYSFAELTPVKSQDGKTITVFLNKPVDRIWANWMGQGEEPEELMVDSHLKATFSTVGHRYQVGAKWVGNSTEAEKGYRQVIVWGAYPSHIQWAANQVMRKNKDNDPIKVVLPHWEVQEITTGKVLQEYSDKLNCTDIHVPEGYKLVKKTGYAVAYSTRGNGSDGSPNLAYITEQNGFIVIYNRAGKIVNVIKQIPESHFFSTLTGAATVRFKLSEHNKWYISDVTEVYPNGRSITAVYSRYGNGKLEDYQVSDF